MIEFLALVKPGNKYTLTLSHLVSYRDWHSRHDLNVQVLCMMLYHASTVPNIEAVT